MSSINTFTIPVFKDGISIDFVNSLKDRGNSNFNQNQFLKAIKEYTLGIQCFKHHDPNGKFDEAACSLLASLYSNRSASYVMLPGTESLTDGIRDANRCIQLKPDWMKGYYRRAECLFMMKEYRLSALDYQNALNLDKNKTLMLQFKLKCAQAKSKEIDMKVLVHQVMPGKDICKKGVNPIQNLIFHYAQQMQNYIYIIGDAVSRECIVIDCCWDVNGIVKYAKENGLKIVGATLVGGIPPPPFNSLRIRVDGLHALLKAFPGIKAYVNPLDIQEIIKMNPNMHDDDFLHSPDNFSINLPLYAENATKTTSIRFIHTPGHTIGSNCILLNESSLFSGDTLFIGTCGRLDLPGSNKDMMCKSLIRLRELPDYTAIYPGHSYNGNMTTIEQEKKTGVLKSSSSECFLG